jgi:hypothetical protein
MRRRSLLTTLLFVLAVFASAGVAVVMAFVVDLMVGSYSGGANPTGIGPALFPLAIVLLVVAGVPAVLLCTLLWLSFASSMRRPTPKDLGDAALGLLPGRAGGLAG